MITSTAHPLVKRIRSLGASSRDRRHERMLVVEGVRLVADALRSGASLTTTLFAPDLLERTAEGRALLGYLNQHPEARPADGRVVAAACDTVTPQGVVALIAWPEPPRQPGMALVLDGIQDPGNLGTLLRSAEAAGAGVVLCGPGCADPYSPKVVRAAMGAHFRLAIGAHLDWPALAAQLGPGPRYAAEAEAGLSYDEADWPSAAALIVGSEAHGLSSGARGLAPIPVAIPMLGGTESLNAAVAGSILLFEALRQRRRGR